VFIIIIGGGGGVFAVGDTVGLSWKAVQVENDAVHNNNNVAMTIVVIVIVIDTNETSPMVKNLCRLMPLILIPDDAVVRRRRDCDSGCMNGVVASRR